MDKTPNNFEERVEEILKAVGVENELQYDVKKTSSGNYVRRTVGSIKRLEFATEAITTLCEKEVRRARISEVDFVLRIAGKGWSKEAQDLMSHLDRTWLREELTKRISDLKTNRE